MESNQGPFAYHPNALQLGQTGSYTSAKPYQENYSKCQLSAVKCGRGIKDEALNRHAL